MIHQAQWAEMRVGDFFGGYPWRGHGSSALMEDTPAASGATSEASSWLGLSVAAFFAQGNWRGKPSTPVLQRPQAPPKPLTVTATVQEFCRGINWSGHGLTNRARDPQSPSPSPPPIAKESPSLGLSDLSELF